MYFPSFFLDQKELKDANLLYRIEYSLKSHLINFSKFFTDKIHAEQKRKKKKGKWPHTSSPIPRIEHVKQEDLRI